MVLMINGKNVLTISKIFVRLYSSVSRFVKSEIFDVQEAT